MAKRGFNWCSASRESMSCYSPEGIDGILRYEDVESTKCCALISSIVEDYISTDGDVGFGTYLLELSTIQLWWWITGTCRCDVNAICSTVGATGFTCRCNQGFIGDGY